VIIRGKSKKVETIKFGVNINSRSGSAYFDEPYSNLYWELYSNKGRSNSFNTPRTMTPLFPSQSSLPDSGLTEEN
jgi:hypothetical protein